MTGRGICFSFTHVPSDSDSGMISTSEASGLKTFIMAQLRRTACLYLTAACFPNPFAMFPPSDLTSQHTQQGTRAQNAFTKSVTVPKQQSRHQTAVIPFELPV